MSVKLSDCLQGREDAVERRSKSLKSVIVFFGGPTTVHYNVLKNSTFIYLAGPSWPTSLGGYIDD